MLAMQYAFTLPADYDMAIIRRRIADKGPALDDFPGLVFKAYLYADRHARDLPSREHRYAPFYLWRDTAAMNAFLEGAGFAALTAAFGWPSVRTWSPWAAELSPAIGAAVCATEETAPIAPYAALDALAEEERDAARRAVARDGALAAVAAFDPTGWTRVRLRLWRAPRPAPAGDGAQHYAVGHVSRPGVPAA